MKILFAMVLLCIVLENNAAVITINDQSQQGQANAVVWLTPNTRLDATSDEQTFTMAQKDRQFTPHILVVEQNSQVEFPNADSIMHHVYSFSKSKSFELKLYREQPQAPITFDKTGVVELGCNIHDWMLGYIVVVDSPFYGITNDQGQLSLDVPQGDYTLNVWHEGFSDISSTESQALVIANNDVSYQLKQKVTPRIAIAVDEFDEYE
ncbi:methylamine utilization protein [Pseudoalteromonas ostreae]|uniref:methylamine utilization protein n=1 Tax=Pseudoalteromonas ostreae TaxID=2774154 RepID=UPI001B37011D|nr:methylamine utilization protein [Pseudoalteromonas ostreae]